MTAVPCNGCRACCSFEIIMLQEDEVARFAHDTIETPVGPAHVLKRQLNGACIHLGDTGCTIHGRAPRVCQAFDCRAWFASKTSAQRRDLLRHPHSREVALAGKARLHTL